MKWIVASILILILAIGLSGCEGDMKGEDSSQVVKKTSAEKKTSEEFRDMVAKKSTLQFMAEYDLSITTQGKTTKYTTAQYLGGPNKLRIDTDMMGVKTRAYLLSDGYYSCNDRQGSWQCMKFASEEEVGQQDYTKDFAVVEKSPDDYDITYSGTKSLAGTTANCWGIDFAGQSMEECFSKEGIPLYMEMSGPGMEYTMKATKYKTSVSSSDFELPAKAQDMQQMANQMMEQMQQQGYEMPEGMEEYE